MGTRSALTALAAAAFVSLGGGCTGAGFWKKKESWSSVEGVPVAPMSPSVTAGNNGVIQAGGIASSASALGSNVPSAFSRMTGKADKTAKGPPVQIAVAWRNKIDYLPDQTRDGAMGPGIAGQVFLFNAQTLPAVANGTLTVDLFDETPRPAGVQGLPPERWTFPKEVLKNLRDVDERFGPNYVVFLPWRSYRPDVTRVKIRTRFDPEGGGFTVFGEETKITLDNVTTSTANNVGAVGTMQPIRTETVPVGPGVGPGLGVFTTGGDRKPAAVPNGTLPPAPAGYGALAPATTTGTPLAPGQLPPMTTVVPGR